MVLQKHCESTDSIDFEIQHFSYQCKPSIGKQHTDRATSTLQRVKFSTAKQGCQNVLATSAFVSYLYSFCCRNNQGTHCYKFPST